MLRSEERCIRDTDFLTKEPLEDRLRTGPPPGQGIFASQVPELIPVPGIATPKFPGQTET